MKFKTKRERIRAFLLKNGFEKFEKHSESQAIAFEKFCKSPFFENVEYSYFVRIYNLEKIQSQ